MFTLKNQILIQPEINRPPIMSYERSSGHIFSIGPHNTIQYNTIQYNKIQYNTIQYNTIQYNTIQYNTIYQ